MFNASSYSQFRVKTNEHIQMKFTASTLTPANKTESYNNSTNGWIFHYYLIQIFVVIQISDDKETNGIGNLLNTYCVNIFVYL